MNLNKINGQKKSNPLTIQPWLKTFQKHQGSMFFRQESQQILEKIRYSPSLEQQKNDLNDNYQLLLQRPLTRLQTQRLFENYAKQNTSLENTFKNFHAIWTDQCIIHADTLKHLDPNYVSPRYANADASRYKDYLIRMLFMMLCIRPIEINTQHDFPYFVEWINGIEQAQTTAKVTLRIQPDIQSDVVLELPKHSIVNVYADENPLWKKIRLAIDNQECFGYVMKAYLKF